MKLMFVDAKEMNRKHPDTFNAPSDEALGRVAPGDYVKVCIDRERFWVAVESHSDKQLTGVVDNDLVCTNKHGLRCGDSITFEERNVYQILNQENLK